MLANQPTYIHYNKSQLDKIGNTVVYLSDYINNLSKTKLLKLLYILDELSIKKSGIPFLNLSYKVWRLGPVAEDLFIDLSSRTILLRDYVDKEITDNKTYIKSKRAFSDDEFSDNDMDLLTYVIKEYGAKTANELIEYTHRENSPWHNTAKENNVLNLLKNDEITNTDHIIDMSQLVAFDDKRSTIYQDYIEHH